MKPTGKVAALVVAIAAFAVLDVIMKGYGEELFKQYRWNRMPT